MTAFNIAWALLKRQTRLSEHGFENLPPAEETQHGPVIPEDEEMARVAREFQESLVPPESERVGHWKSEWPNIAPDHRSNRIAYGPDPTTGRWVAKIPTHQHPQRRSPIRDWAEAAWSENLPVQPEKQFGGFRGVEESSPPFFLQRYVEPSKEEQAQQAAEAEAQHAVDEAQQQHDALISEGGTGLVHGQPLEGEQEAQHRIAVLAARDERDKRKEELEALQERTIEPDETAESEMRARIKPYGFDDIHPKNIVGGQNIDPEQFSAGLPRERVAPMRARAEGHDTTGLGREQQDKPPTFYRDLHAQLLAQEEPPAGASHKDWAAFRDSLMPHLQARATAEGGQRFLVDWGEPPDMSDSGAWRREMERQGLVPEGYTPEGAGHAGQFGWESADMRRGRQSWG